MESVVLIMLTDMQPDIIDALTKALQTGFDRKIDVKFQLGSLRYAYDPSRDQYISPKILARLNRIKKPPGDRIIAVADVDMYSPGYDFIYGEADVNAGTATLATKRLQFESNGSVSLAEVTRTRIVREALHEVGHLFGLIHCSRSDCVMRTCTCQEEVDAANGGFCPACLVKLHRPS